MSLLRDIASMIAAAWAMKPDAHATGTVEHTGIDTNHANGVRFLYSLADVSGGGTLALQVQDSATGVVDSISDPVFTGSGDDDAASGGTFTGTADATFTIEIDAEGTPDTFKWKKDDGAYTTGVAITGAAQTLSDGVTVTFTGTDNHTLADVWVITCVADTYADVSGKTTGTLSAVEDGEIVCWNETDRFVRIKSVVVTAAVDAACVAEVHGSRVYPNDL